MSGIFQQVIYELKIKQYSSLAYHPESQGALERFHQTLKTMIKTYCFDTEKCWDKGIHLLWFAARESVQESLGFSPFELVFFGHTVSAPALSAPNFDSTIHLNWLLTPATLQLQLCYCRKIVME